MQGIEWLGHDGFKIDFKITGPIYVDPYNVKDGHEKASVILITHEHYDHCSIADIMKLSNSQTEIFIPPDCQSKISDFPGKVSLVEPNRKYNSNGIDIETVPAYNINKAFHPKENGWVGYVLSCDGKRIYHAGDTDLIPEMENLKDIDVALLPVSGTYVMTASEAALACKKIKPKVAIPMHYGAIIGSVSDAEKFKSLCESNVEILEKV